MKTGIKVLIAAAVVGGGVYVGWPMIKKLTAKKDNTAEADPLVDTGSNNAMDIILSKASTAATAPTLTDKVKTLQKLIGVTADGAAGPITMARLNKYLVVDQLSSANIDNIIKWVDVISRAVNSLSSRVKDTKANKAKMWQFWVDKAKSVNMKFDPVVKNAYINITGRSAYKDYADVVKTPTKYDAYPYPQFYGVGEASFNGLQGLI